jgi:hypothetical protein
MSLRFPSSSSPVHLRIVHPLLLALALAAAPALAERGPSLSTGSSLVRPGGSSLLLGQTGIGPNRFATFRLELHLAFNWYGGIGGGVRLEFPLAPRGILVEVDDEIALSFGAEVFYFYTPGFLGAGVSPLVALQWNFYVANTFSVFPEVGVAFLFGPGRDRYWGTFVAPFFGFGGRFHFTDRNALVVRAGWPAGLQVGLTF